jgi:hypothetical protein
MRLGTVPDQVAQLARTIPLLPSPLQKQVKEYLRRHVDRYLLNEKLYRFQAGAKGAYRFALYQGPPPVTWQGEDYLNGRTLFALWSYAHYTGDWPLVARHWDFVNTLFNAYRDAIDWQIQAAKGAGWHTQSVLSIEIQGLIAVGRMARAMGDRAVQDRVAYLLPKYYLTYLATWKGPTYVTDVLGGDPRVTRMHGTHRFDGMGVVPLTARSGEVFHTRVQGWLPSGPTLCGDPTHYAAPWPVLFNLAQPETLRFLRDWLLADMTDTMNLYLALFQETLEAPVGYMYYPWGLVTPFFQAQAYVLNRDSRTLDRWLRPPVCLDDPFYLMNLLALIHADGAGSWRDVGADYDRVAAELARR